MNDYDSDCGSAGDIPFEHSNNRKAVEAIPDYTAADIPMSVKKLSSTAEGVNYEKPGL